MEYWIGIVVTLLVGIVPSVFAFLASRNSRKAERDVKALSERNKAISKARVEQDLAAQAREEALIELVVELCWALKRHGIGNGELEQAIGELTRANQKTHHATSTGLESLKGLDK